MKRWPGKRSTVAVPSDLMDAFRIVLAAACALEAHPDDGRWPDRLAWAVRELPADERTYFTRYAEQMDEL